MREKNNLHEKLFQILCFDQLLFYPYFDFVFVFGNRLNKLSYTFQVLFDFLDEYLFEQPIQNNANKYQFK